MCARVVSRVGCGVQLTLNLGCSRAQPVKLSKQIQEASILIVPQSSLTALTALAALGQTRGELRRCDCGRRQAQRQI
eukprot:1528054-Rhodomonas_salina.2